MLFKLQNPPAPIYQQRATRPRVRRHRARADVLAFSRQDLLAERIIIAQPGFVAVQEVDLDGRAFAGPPSWWRAFLPRALRGAGRLCRRLVDLRPC